MKKIIVILLFLPLFSNATKIYMNATSGNDGAAGTSPATAWQTLTKLNTQFLSAGDTVFFNRGDVFYGRLNCTKTGAAGNPIVYTTYGSGAAPVITGYTTLTTWASTSITGVYASPCSNLKQYCHNLSMDGNFQNIARFPNSTYLIYTPVSTTSIIDATQTGTPSRVGDSIVVKDSRYTLTHSKVTAQSTSTLTINAVNYSGVGGIGYFYFNASKFLDTLGEWVVNSTLDSVYIYFGAGGPGGHTVQVSTVDTLVYMSGAFNKVLNLHITGGNIANIFDPFGTGTNYIYQCTIDYAYNGIDVRAQHDTILNNTFSNILNNAVTAPTNNISKYMLIKGNIFRRVGLWPGMGGSGGDMYFTIHNPSQGCTQSYNDIDSVGYAGVFFAGDSSVASYNHVNHYGLTLADVGGIYYWTQSTPSYTYYIAIDTNLVENGVGNTDGIVFDPNTEANGIYIDGHAALGNVIGNTSINNSGTGVFCHGSSINILYNNIYNNGYAQCSVQEFSGIPVTNVNIKQNTFASPDTTKPVIFFFTPGTDILTMGVADSNYYVTTNGVAPFSTQSNGGSLIKRTFSSWKSFMGFDAASTYQTGVYNLTYNSLFTSKNIYYTGKYVDPSGITFNQLIPLNLLSSAILKTLDIGIITTIPGAKIVVH